MSSAGFDGRSGPATYGAIDLFTRVSTHTEWIDSVMRAPSRDAAPTPARAMQASAVASVDTVIPRTVAGRHFSALIAAARAGTDSAVAAFVRAHFDAREVQSRPMLVPNLQRIARQLQRAPIAAIVESKEYELTVRFTANDGPMTLQLVASPTAPHPLVDWRRFD